MLHCSVSFTRPLKGTRHSKENQNSQAKFRVSDLIQLKYEFVGWGCISVHTHRHLLCLCMNSSQYRYIFTEHDRFAEFSK